MSNGIYDILGKLNGLKPKDNPVSMSAEPIYESVDSRGAIISAVTQLQEKYSNFKQAPVDETKRKPGKNKNDDEEPVSIAAADKINYQDVLDPRAKEVIRKARVATPGAKNDLEAIVAHIAKQDDDMVRVKQREEELHDELMQQQKINADQEKRFRELDDKYKTGAVGDQEAADEREKIQKDIDKQRQTAAATAKTEKGKKAANVYNFPKKTKSVATPTAKTAQQPAPVAEPTADTSADTSTDTSTDVGTSSFAKTAAMLQNQPTTAEIPQITPKSKKQANYGNLAQALGESQSPVDNYTGEEAMMPSSDKPLGKINAEKISGFMRSWDEYTKALQRRNEPGFVPPGNPANSVRLDFPNGVTLNLSKDSIVRLLQAVRGLSSQDKQAFVNFTLGDKDQLQAWIANLNRPQPKKPTLKKGQTVDWISSAQPDTAKPMNPGVNYKLPQGSRDEELQESLGNKTMTKPTSIIEAVRSVEYKKLKEAAKPDFLDLDKDGDTDEPMKKAAKDAKDHEPDAPDESAVAKRKRLQALKDKQEDERAEKGDDYKSASRFVKGRAYGGSAQKDDEDKDELEEGTNFGDTIKNSAGKMTKVKVTEGKDAIRNHPIYTTKEAWDHYSQELAEQEMMEQAVMTPVVNVQQELDEIAALAGLPPRMEAKSVCPSCKCEKCECNENLDPMVPADSVSPLTHTLEGTGCTMEELQEAMSRKDYRTMANKIKNMDDRDLAGEMCQTFAEMAKADNPRFKEDMFFAACDIKNPASVLVDEEAMDEGNEFTKARLDAIAQGKDTFSVGGKTHNVSGDTSDEKTQVESVNEDINVNITANGEQDALNLLRKLSGMAEVPRVTGIAIPMGEEHATCEACGATPCGCEEAVEEERDIELANTPHETVAPINAVTTDAGGGIGGPKKQYPLAANRGANPLEEEKLWSAYESMIKDVKA